MGASCLDEGRERRAHLAHRAENAMLRRAGFQPELTADLADRHAFDVPERERRTLDGGQARHRLADAGLDLSGKDETIGQWLGCERPRVGDVLLQLGWIVRGLAALRFDARR
jgi:hypothetical protein